MSVQPIQLRDRLINQMKTVFGTDYRRINHALSVLSYAEKILHIQGGDPLVVQAAAILHDIGILQAELTHGSSAGHYQELEGPPIARKIMHQLGIDPERIEHVCRIVGSHHSGRDLDTPEFLAVWDADWIVNIPEVWPGKTAEDLRRRIDHTLRTAAGRSLATRIYCGSSDAPA